MTTEEELKEVGRRLDEANATIRKVSSLFNKIELVFDPSEEYLEVVRILSRYVSSQGKETEFQL